MKVIQTRFSSLKYAGQAEGDKRAYHIFEGADSLLVVSASSPRSYNVSAVDREGIDLVSRKFKGRKVTSGDILRKSGRPDLFKERFDALNALYAMVATGRARKLKQRDGKAIVFKIK